MTRQTIIHFPNGEYADITQGIIKDSLNIVEIISDNNNIAFGNIISSKLEMELVGVTDLKGLLIQLYSSETENNVTTLHPLFNGYIYTCKVQKVGNYRKIIAYDKYYGLDTTKVNIWYNTLLPSQVSTCTIKQMRESILTYFGISFPNQNLTNDNMTISKNVTVDILLFSDVVKCIGQITGTFGHFMRDGSFKWIQLPSNNPTNISNNLKSDFNYEEYTTDTITCIKYMEEGKTIAFTGERITGNVYTISDNFLFYQKGRLKMALNNLLNNCLRYIRYTPLDAECIVSDLSLNVGDYVNFKENKNCYILKMKLSGVQLFEQSIECKGDKKYDEESVDSASYNIISQQNSNKSSLGIYTKNGFASLTLTTNFYKILDLTVSTISSGGYAVVLFSTELYNNSSNNVLVTFTLSIDGASQNDQVKRDLIKPGYNIISFQTFFENTTTGNYAVGILGKCEASNIITIDIDKSKLIVFGTGLKSTEVKLPNITVADEFTLFDINNYYALNVNRIIDSNANIIQIPVSENLVTIFNNFNINSLYMLDVSSIIDDVNEELE